MVVTADDRVITAGGDGYVRVFDPTDPDDRYAKQLADGL